MATVPLLLLLCAYVAIDPFKVLRWHDDPFADRLGLNKGMLSVQAYEKGLSSGRKYDSFIMGSSVSCTYGSYTLHIVSSGQTVSTLRKYLEYLESSGAPLRNVLIVFAPEIFGIEYDCENLSVLVPPAVERGGVRYMLSFHYKYFMGFANYRYISPLLVYEFTGRREKVTDVPVFSMQPICYDWEINEESVPEWDMILDKDPALLHEKSSYDFSFTHDTPYTRLATLIDNDEKSDLEAIAALLARNRSDYRVLLAPTPKLYLLSYEDESVLSGIFGDRFVNVSGKFRAEQSDSSNFYDTIHYRSRLASKYMQAAYIR